MLTVKLDFVEDSPLPCTTCARRLRRALEGVRGIEEISISICHQQIAIGYNMVLLDCDDLGEILADLGYVVRPARRHGRLTAGTIPKAPKRE